MTVKALSMRVVSWLCVVTLFFAATVIAAPVASAAGVINQNSPTSGTTDVGGSAIFTDTLSATSNLFPGDSVTFVSTATNPPSPPGLNVTNLGVITTTGTLAAGSYTVSGTD